MHEYYVANCYQSTIIAMQSCIYAFRTLVLCTCAIALTMCHVNDHSNNKMVFDFETIALRRYLLLMFRVFRSLTIFTLHVYRSLTIYVACLYRSLMHLAEK